MLMRLVAGARTLLILMGFLAGTSQPYMLCKTGRVSLEARGDKQVLMSSEYELGTDETVYCTWEITAENASDVIQFQVIHWFAPSTSDCSNDYLLLSDDAGMWTRPLGIWCRRSAASTTEVMKSRTATLTVELTSSIYWTERVVFALEYWTAPQDIEVVNAVEFGPANYVLFALSSLIGLVLLLGCCVLVYKEFARFRAARMLTWKEKLMVRRKGISGQAIHRKDSVESSAQSDVTSYIQLTETPTSIRCSSAWTPSPVTRISVSESDTPTSGNFSL